jgi:hypothetical protein
MGTTIDPRTQRMVPSAGATETVERWISFVISGHGVNALQFVEEVARQARGLAEEMSTRFDLG